MRNDIDHLNSLAQAHIERVDSLRKQGLKSKPAQGYTKYALKVLSIADPAQTIRVYGPHQSVKLDFRSPIDEVSEHIARELVESGWAAWRTYRGNVIQICDRRNITGNSAEQSRINEMCSERRAPFKCQAGLMNPR